MTDTFKIDMHMHTCASRDGAVHPADVIRVAKQKGLDRICITDHNTLDGALLAKEIDPEFVIVGEEIRTDRNCEILAFFVKELVPPDLRAEEALDRLQAQGAVISISHPFDRHRNQPWTEEWLEAILPQIDAIEAFNARTVRAVDNEKARIFATAHDLPTTAGSDAHTAMEIGRAFVELPAFTSADELRTSLPQATIYGRLSPGWIHVFSAFNVWRGRFGFKPRLKVNSC